MDNQANANDITVGNVVEALTMLGRTLPSPAAVDAASLLVMARSACPQYLDVV